MNLMTYEDKYSKSLVELWDLVFPDPSPHNHAERSLIEKVKHQKDLIFIAVDNDKVIGSVNAGYDGHRGWLYNIATHPDHRGEGIAKKLIEMSELKLEEMGCVKVNLQVIKGNEVTDFYEKLGYRIEPRISMGKELGPYRKKD